MTVLRLGEADFVRLRQLIGALTGIQLDDSKLALVESRLGHRLHELGLDSFHAYYRRLQSGEDSAAELQNLVDRITTQTTSFFRELIQFQYVGEQLLPEWLARTQPPLRRLRLWSAGCSTGQEPYSLAAVVHHGLRNVPAVDARILATDVSHRALSTAHKGVYEDATDLIPFELRPYFSRRKQGTQSELSVVPPLRKLVVFRLLNLLTEELPFRSQFTGIFCRNVLIYFRADLRQRVVAALSQHLEPGGCLFLGLSEGLVEIPSGLRQVGPAIYQRVGSPTEPPPGRPPSPNKWRDRDHGQNSGLGRR
jgi:chemotaxis protein methyltransferase CheR